MNSPATLNFDKPSYDWTVFKNQQFSVSIHAWHSFEGFGWNVYANIFDTHPLHLDPQNAMDSLHLHGGATYDKYVTYEPSLGVKHDWQTVSKTLKIGSDYLHLYDDWAPACDPADGVPMQIQSDARELVEQLLARQAIPA
jgi:hypothetical protein